MEQVFVDTSAWDAIEDNDDSYHASALAAKSELVRQRLRWCTTNFVLDECYTLLLSNVGYTHTLEFKRTIDLLCTGGILVVIHISEQIESAAWNVFERFNRDKTWSFTDCTSKVVMESLGIMKVFTYDHHFEQMGFEILPPRKV
jgi:predicted nucleic acid-binding protein